MQPYEDDYHLENPHWNSVSARVESMTDLELIQAALEYEVDLDQKTEIGETVSSALARILTERIYEEEQDHY